MAISDDQPRIPSIRWYWFIGLLCCAAFVLSEGLDGLAILAATGFAAVGAAFLVHDPLSLAKSDWADWTQRQVLCAVVLALGGALLLAAALSD